MMKNGGSMECVQIHPPLKAKQHHKSKKNRVGKQKVTKELKHPGGNWAAMAVAATTVRLWWPLAGAVSSPCSAAFWCIFWSTFFASDQHVLGLLGFSCKLS